MSGKPLREFWMDTESLDEALERCDLGDASMTTVRQYPHKDSLQYLTRVREVLPEQDAAIKQAVEALQSIARVKYGLELTDTDEYLLEHWSKQALRYEQEAREALTALKEAGVCE